MCSAQDNVICGACFQLVRIMIFPFLLNSSSVNSNFFLIFIITYLCISICSQGFKFKRKKLLSCSVEAVSLCYAGLVSQLNLHFLKMSPH